MFQFDQAQICDPLKPYLQAIFHYEDFVPDHSIERVVPTGHIFILFELDGFERYTYDEKQNIKQKFCGAWISGIQRAPISISAHAHSQMFVMQFKALGAAPFLGLPVQQFTDQVVPGADVLDGSLLVLREALLNCQTVQARFELAQALHAAGEVQEAVDQLLDLFRRDREWNDGAAKEQLFKIFDSLGPMDEMAKTGRRKLSSMIFA